MVMEKKSRKDLTPEELEKWKVKERRYQQRSRQKKKLFLKVFDFLEQVNIYTPAGMTETQLRKVHIQVNSILNLPARWTDKDLAWAYKNLERIAKSVYGTNYANFSENYETLLSALTDTFEHLPATREEQIRAAFEILNHIELQCQNENDEAFFRENLNKFMEKHIKDSEK